MLHEAITIRVATEQDAPELLKIYAPYVEHTAVTFEYEVPSVEEFAGRIRTVLSKYPYLVAQSGGEILGYCYVGPYRGRPAYGWAVETSIYVRQDCKRMGIGRRLYAALENILKMQGILNLNACIGYPRVEDEHLTRNSVKFHEKLGYQFAGQFHCCGHKFDRWYDVVWMEKLIGEHHAGQSAVKSFDAVREQVQEKLGIC
ncbi:MAG: GNAT family N-acetyltransferase [Oscillibacter sp.]|jgi:phosphinothricin acetyltransferase|nr:GNAT family N-acetyltransferase [Oscillibacter sp.]